MRNPGPGTEVAYGSDTDLDSTRLLVEQVLGIGLEPRESLYLGGDYYLGQLPGGGQVQVRANLDLIDGCREWPSWPGPAFAEIFGDDPELVGESLLGAGLTLLTREG